MVADLEGSLVLKRMNDINGVERELLATFRTVGLNILL